MAAYRAENRLSARDYGCWSTGAQSNLPSGLTYSMPLMLEDGTLYGVLGIGDAGRLSVQPSALRRTRL
ncbi:MAG: hypothetical protein ACLUHE_07360 [Christensenellales bacterium]